MTHKDSSRRSRLPVSLLITLTLVVPIAYLVSPWISRQIHIAALTSADTARRQRGLSHLVANAPGDRRLADGAMGSLSVDDDANFLEIVDALQAAGCWDRARVPDRAWLRWIILHAREPGVEAPAMAAQRLADLQNMADNPRVMATLSQLHTHAEPDVRYNALCAAAELMKSAESQAFYHALMVDRLRDDEPMIARHALLFAYLTGASGVSPPDWLAQTQERPADEHYSLDAINNLLHSPDAALRDVGCVLAVRDLSQAELMNLVPGLFHEADDHAKCSGAILSGMTGIDPDLLTQQIESQTDWATAALMKLGLWMHSDGLSDEVRPPALLAHGDVPRSTILLAMLHRQDAQALEVLLNPRGESPDDLAVLLEDYGWWRVLDRYLPDDAPHWMAGTETGQQALQIDLLRDWYLVNRHRMLFGTDSQ